MTSLGKAKDFLKRKNVNGVITELSTPVMSGMIFIYFKVQKKKLIKQRRTQENSG
jgi:hypothetical protein